MGHDVQDNLRQGVDYLGSGWTTLKMEVLGDCYSHDYKLPCASAVHCTTL